MGFQWNQYRIRIYTMIEFYRLTGKSDGDRIQVKARTGEEMYAPMFNVGTSTSVPTQKWLLENKDNFIALVSYERDSFSRPLIIGFYPVKGAKSSDFDLMLKVMNLFDNLLEHLLQAKTNTMMGPQMFFPDTIQKIQETKVKLEELKQERLEINK